MEDTVTLTVGVCGFASQIGLLEMTVGEEATIALPDVVCPEQTTESFEVSLAISGTLVASSYDKEANTLTIDGGSLRPSAAGIHFG